MSRNTAQDSMIVDGSVPASNPVVGNPGTVPQGRDLAAERDAEMARERAAAKAKEDRFTVKKFTATQKFVAPAAPEYESLIFKTAANYPFQDLQYPSVSQFVPNLSAFFYLLNYMDHLMCNTRKWTENCSGWAPPLSQMYFTVLIYYQIFRAMDAAGIAPPDAIIFLQQFERLFPLADLWIPGPLVAAFRALSAFRPDANDLFAGVTVALPAQPGWTAANNYQFAAGPSFLIPNLNVYLTRLRAICNVALTANMTEANFIADINGPRSCQNLFGTQVANNANFQGLFHNPGSSFIYGGNLLLWQNCARMLTINSVPADLVAATLTPVNDTWTSAMRFENGEHIWFSPIFAMMGKYCQFWNGSVPLSEIAPVSSAAGAVKLRLTAATTIYTTPPFVAAVGGPPAVAAHFNLRSDARLVFDAQVALRDIPDAHICAGITYAYNAYDTAANQALFRTGRFWTLGPDVKSAYTIEILPGATQVIAREYHRDTRLEAHKQ